MPWVFINMLHGIYLLCCLELQKQNLFFMLQAVVDILRNASKVKCHFFLFYRKIIILRPISEHAVTKVITM